MSIKALPHVSLLGFLFGSTLVASRFSVGQFAPATYIGLRLLIASLCYALLFLFSRRHAWPRDRGLWGHSTLVGVLGTAVPMTAIVSSLQFQSSGITSILITASPALTVLMAHFFLADESLTRRKAAGIALAMAGALLLALRGETGLPEVDRANPLGYALVLLAMVIGSATTVYMRKRMSQYDALQVSSVRLLTAALVVVPFSLLSAGFDLGQVTAAGYEALAYASLVGTFSGLLLAFYIVQRFGATTAAMTGYLLPLVASTGGALFLQERVTAGMLLGMAVIVAGIALLNQRQLAGPPVNIPGD